MKRIILVLLVAVITLSCLSACKNKSTEPTEPTAATEPTEPTVPYVDTLAHITFDSPEQEAVVKTALCYLDRGSRIQYDDTRFSSKSAPVVYRWQVGERPLESYTTQYLGYINCAVFTHDVYWEALNYDIGSYTTASLIATGKSKMMFKYTPTGDETKEDRQAIINEFYSIIQRGDIIVTRNRGNSNGHAMLYVGDGIFSGGSDIIHSTGSNYEYAGGEAFERNGTVRTMSSRSLFSSGSSGYVFENASSFGIVRPLNTFYNDVPQKTKNRMKNLMGVVAEKLCSHTYGMTVNPGEEMTFTFSVSNKNDHAVGLTISDIVPEHTSYVSGAEFYRDRELIWKVTIPAKTTKTVSYTVRVDKNTPYGESIFSNAGMVGGVDVDCPQVFVEKTLTADQQSAIKNAVKNHAGSPKRGISLADEIYTSAVAGTTGLPHDADALMDKLYMPFSLPQYRLNSECEYLNMIVPSMMGGRYVSPRTLVDDYMRLEGIRTRLPYARDLIVGDIIVAYKQSYANKPQQQFLFLGDTLLDLVTGELVDSKIILESILGYDRFAILRPSMMADY